MFFLQWTKKMVGFKLEQRGEQIMGRLTQIGGLEMNDFKTKYRAMLEQALQENIKLRVLFDLTHGCEMQVFLAVKDDLFQFFEKEIKHLSESVITQCIVVIPHHKIKVLIQTMINLVGSKVPTSLFTELPNKKPS